MLQKYKTKKFYDYQINPTLGQPTGTGTYTVIGSNYTSNGLTLSSSMTLPGTAPQLFVLMSDNAAGGTITACTIAGVSLTPIVNGQLSLFQGTVAATGSQTVSVTYSTGVFNSKGFTLWALNGLSSTAAVQTANGTIPQSIVTTGGDLLFSVNNAPAGGVGNYAASTASPVNVQGNPPFTNFLSTADWTLHTNNLGFSVNPNVAGGGTVLAATWH